jgi:hypothetical protein
MEKLNCKYLAGFKLNCFKRFFRFMYFSRWVLWKFKVSVNEIKVEFELERSQMCFWFFLVHSNTSEKSDDLLSHEE